MILTGQQELDAFKRKHPDSRKALDPWRAAIEKGGFKDFVELKAAFPAVDYVKGSPFTVFDIRGNNYRLAVVIVYRANRCIVEQVMTHDEYLRWSRKL